MNENSNEFLLDNKLTSDLQRFLRPLYIMQFVSFGPKFLIRDGFITSNSTTVNIIRLCFAICYFIIYIAIVSIYRIKYFSKFLLNVMIFSHLLYYGSSILLNSILITIHNDINVKLILKIQKIHRFLKFQQNAYKNLIVGNWIFIIIIFLYYFMIILVQIYLKRPILIFIFLHACLLMNDLNLIYIIRLIVVLRKATVVWTSKLEQMYEMENKTLKCEGRHLRQTARWEKIFKTYIDLIEAFHAGNKILEIQIIYFIILTFIQTLINVQVVIEITMFDAAVSSLFSWSIKNIFLLTVLSWEYENSYIAHKNIQVVCLMIKCSGNVSSEVYLVCKQLWRESVGVCELLNSHKFFKVDAALPLRLLSAIIVYVIVLLQFAFL
ncbi:unnamed protein product [Parnassius mnemosyne]|uniref:Gustatory receptor n=1 Tax=Parnassius mnemosyne TaxID=213953 RepID=A0AAV1LBH4_9NEOP